MKKKRINVFNILMVIFIVTIGVMVIGYVSFILNEVVFVNQYDDTVLERLEVLSKEDNRIEEIIDNSDTYPEDILNMLSYNIETLDFVLNYHSKKGNVYSDNIGNVTIGEIPLLLQWDERWGYAFYGDSVIATTGCAPTALAMVVAGLTGKNDVTPYDIAKYADDNGYYSLGGTSWSIMTEGSKNFGVVGSEITLSKNVIYDYLKNGYPIICSVRPGDFTSSGHFIVLTGIYDNKIKINDPNSIERSNMLWEYEKLQSQIKNLWFFQKI